MEILASTAALKFNLHFFLFFLVTDHNAPVLICVYIQYKTHIRLLFFTLCWITSLWLPGALYEQEGCPAP